MYVGRDFSRSDVGESEVYTFDFSRDLATGETISSATWTCVVKSGTDAGAAGHISGAPTNVGQLSSQRVTGLLAGVVYILQALAITSAGNTVSLFSHVTGQTPA